MRKAAARHDRKAFAALLTFPAKFNVNGRPTYFASQEQFLRHYDALITQSVVKALATSEIQDLIVNYQGAAAGNGEIWFAVDAQGRFCLIAVNNR